MDFQNYYQTELVYLRDVGKAFAEKHPALAGMLAERGGDPDVERLLEGFAFIAARFRQRIDDSVPELVETLTDLLLPHFLRPTPATTIVQFQSSGEGPRGAYSMPAGAALQSVPVHGTRCRFRSTRPLALLPLRLAGLRLDDASSSTPLLSLRFELPPGAQAAVLRREGLRLHLHGELPITTQLYLWLARHVASVSLRAHGKQVELGARSIRVVGFDEQDSLFPWPSFAPQGPRFLLEYFTLQTKFLFIDVLDLDRAGKLEGDGFELAIQFARPPALPGRLPDDVVRLHCVPAVNLFDTSAEPVRIGVDARPVLLRAQGIEPLHAEVFDVRSVLGVNAARPERRSYEAFQAFRHALRSAKHPGFYALKRERSPVDDGLHTFLRLDSSAREPTQLEPETLSIELTCTNRSLPAELSVGELRVPTSDTPSGVSFANIGLVSRPTRPPLGSDLAWHFVAHLSAFRRGMADLEALKAMLLLYNRQEDVDFPAASANRARVDAIRQIRMRPTTRVHRGAPVRGALFEVELDSRGFTSEGDAFLFGSVLHRFLSLGAPLNGFADLHMVLLPTRVDFRWSAELS